MADPLRIGVRSLDGTTLVVLVGEADLATCEQLRAMLTTCRGHVVVDLSGVSILDASNIGVLVSAQNRLSAKGGSLRLFSPTASVSRVLDVLGLALWIDPPPTLSGVTGVPSQCAHKPRLHT